MLRSGLLESITWSWKNSVHNIYQSVNVLGNPLHGVESARRQRKLLTDIMKESITWSWKFYQHLLHVEYLDKPESITWSWKAYWIPEGVTMRILSNPLHGVESVVTGVTTTADTTVVESITWSWKNGIKSILNRLTGKRKNPLHGVERR